MAFLPNQQDPNNPQGQQQGQIPQIPVIPSLQGTSGPSASTSGGSGVTNTATPAGAPSSPWQNVTAYLQANAGQAGGVADVLSNNLTQQYNTANQGIQNAQQNYGQQIESARNPYNQQVADAAKASPSQFAQDPNNVASFQKMYGGQYGGPADFSSSQNYSDLAGQVTKAQKQAGLTKQGTSGLMTLLQQAESQAGRNPTQGITALDSLLLQESPDNFTKISNAAAPFSNLTSFLGSTQQGLDTQARQAAQEAAATGSKLQGEYMGPGGIVPTFSKNMADQLQGASQKATSYNQNITDVMNSLNAGKPLTNNYPNWSSSNVDPTGTLETLNPYGLSGGVFPSMLSMGLGTIGPNYLAQYYQAPDQIAQPGLENVMSPEQFADAQALNQMIGAGTVQAPEALGQAFATPQGMGSFNSQGALQGLRQSLLDQQSYLPYMTPEQQSAWLNDLHALEGYMGMGPTPQPIAPTPPPTPPPDPLHPIDNGGGNWLGFV